MEKQDNRGTLWQAILLEIIYESEHSLHFSRVNANRKGQRRSFLRRPKTKMLSHNFIQIFLMPSLFSPLYARPHQQMTGTKPRFLDAARQTDIAIPLENSTFTESTFFGRLFQEALGGYINQHPLSSDETTSSTHIAVDPSGTNRAQILQDP